MVFGTADAAKWVKRREYCLTQPRATISINIPTGPCGGPAAEAAERRLGALPHCWGGWDRPGFFLVHGGETHDNLLLVFDGVVFDGARGEEAADS